MKPHALREGAPRGAAGGAVSVFVEVPLQVVCQARGVLQSVP
jgi:hypothetical protein